MAIIIALTISGCGSATQPETEETAQYSSEVLAHAEELANGMIAEGVPPEWIEVIDSSIRVMYNGDRANLFVVDVSEDDITLDDMMKIYYKKEAEAKAEEPHSIGEIIDLFHGNKLAADGLYLEYTGCVNYIDETYEKDGYYIQLTDLPGEDWPLVYCYFYGADAKERVLNFTVGDTVHVLGTIKKIDELLLEKNGVDDISIICEEIEKV